MSGIQKSQMFTIPQSQQSIGKAGASAQGQLPASAAHANRFSGGAATSAGATTAARPASAVTRQQPTPEASQLSKFHADMSKFGMNLGTPQHDRKFVASA